ncbi:MAG: hypothetical protein JKY66_09375 [Spongiibacteraceae bacterium]|nr:hypothetical protein [Spongiibacteraceae bacterium]MBN4055523.1 hypothetical protein [bacterium AH-315-K03]
MSYLAKETLISSVINALFSLIFFIVFFHDVSEVTLGGVTPFTLDFLPQAFFVGLFAALPVSLLAVKRIRSGEIKPELGQKYPLPQSLPIRIIILALLSLVVFGVGALGLSSFFLPVMDIGFTAALLLKVIFGILITVVVTPVAVRSVLVVAKV